MNEKITKDEPKFSNKGAIGYSLGQFSVITSFNTFNFLVFIFYYTIVGLNVVLISIGFMIWSVWNAINDPLMGYLSDRTHTKWGRRMPYIIFSLIPLGIIIFFLFTPPISVGITDEFINFIYFVIIILIFELIYTIFSLNVYSLFPEVFITSEERSKANNIAQTIGVFALIMAFMMPTLFITDLTNPKYLIEYQIFGVVIALVIIIPGLLFLRFCPKEKAEFKLDYKEAPSFIDSIKIAVKNKSFMLYVTIKTANWFVIGLMTALVSLYAKFILGIGEGETIFIGLLMATLFISVAIFINILWKPVVQKIGPRKAWMISMLIWIITIAPLMFIQDKILGLIMFFLMGIGLSGTLYFPDLIISDIIDEDEVNTEIRKEAAYYGVNFFFIRLSFLFVFIAISLVFTSVGWATFAPEKVTPEVIFGIKTLVVIIPIIALVIGFLAMYIYPLYGERLTKVKDDLQKLHEVKKLRI